MHQPLDAQALDQLFRNARTYPRWQDRPVTEGQLREIYELCSLGPTSMNCQPGRYVFLTTSEAKERLVPALMEGNVAKVREAPVTVIVAQDTRFHDRMYEVWPHNPDAGAMFASNPRLADMTASRNSTLQGAYLILAARALGLDTGPMSGFDNALVDAEFFPDGRYRSNFLVSLGYGEPSALHPRGPRLSFEQVASLL
jgi:3-hydroxypropanoate dehydrogenase